MNILHLANTPLSGAPYKLMQVQRIGGINSRLISHKCAYDQRSQMVYPYDILLQSGKSNREKRAKPDFSKDEVYSLFEQADIIHTHNYLVDLYIFRLFPELKKYLKTKLVVLQFHSPRLSLKNVEEDLRHKDVDRRFVVAQYQVRQFPEATLVPNAIPINHEYYSPIDRDNCPPIITYSPSNTTLSGWNNKGYPCTLAVLKRLCTISRNLVITNTPYLECLKKKQKADIAIDEVVTGSYHLNTLEALSQGQVAICGMDSKCEEVLCKYTNTTFHPIVVASPKTLESVLKDYILNPQKLKDRQKYSRDFMTTFWSTEYINKHFKKAYEGTL